MYGRFEVRKRFLMWALESTPILHRGKGLVWLDFPDQPSTYAIFLRNIFQFYQWCPTNELHI
jgi:hypothetical protein